MKVHTETDLRLAVYAAAFAKLNDGWQTPEVDDAHHKEAMRIADKAVQANQREAARHELETQQ